MVEDSVWISRMSHSRQLHLHTSITIAYDLAKAQAVQPQPHSPNGDETQSEGFQALPICLFAMHKRVQVTRSPAHDPASSGIIWHPASRSPGSRGPQDGLHQSVALAPMPDVPRAVKGVFRT